VIVEARVSKVSEATQRLKNRDDYRPGGIALILPDWQTAFRAEFRKWMFEMGMYPKKNWLNRK